MSIREFLIYKVCKMIPDRIWIQIRFLQHFGRFCNLKNPQTFNEKLQWLKLYDRKDEYTVMVDKYLSKEFVAHRIGEEYVVPVVGGPWKSFEEIDFDALPDQFVLKTNHDCGGVVVCTDKDKFDKKAAEKFLTWHLKSDYYLTGREWPYKNVPRCIFAEQYMQNDSLDNSKSLELTDYKFFCFDGKPKIMFIATDRNSQTEETKFDFFDMGFNHLPIINGHPNAKIPLQKPENFEVMKDLAAKLSSDFPHVRVDFYNCNGKVYFGELTLFHFSGMQRFKPEKWDYKLGSWINLPEKRNSI